MNKTLLALLVVVYSNTVAQHWENVNGGSNYVVQCMYHDTMNNLLYVGGQFDSVGTISAHKIAIWDGTNWTSVGTNADLFGNAEAIQTITIFNNELIIGGLFDSIGNIPAKNIARWNGQWNAMGNGFDGGVKTLKEYKGELYAGGSFKCSGNDTLNYISKWDGSNWTKINQGLDNSVSVMLPYKDTLVIGGSFVSNYEGTVASGSVIGYDGNSWFEFNNGLSPSTINLKIIRDTLYAVGSFSNNITGIHYISKYVGNSWLPCIHPTGGVQPWVTDIVEFMNLIYVCGFFTMPPKLGSFDGISFDSIANIDGYINHLEVYKNDLYITGSFTSINNISFRNIAKYTFSDDIDDRLFPNKHLFAYPNPVNRNLNLELDFPVVVKYPINLFLYSSTGSLIFSQNILDRESQIILNNNKSGIYYLQCLDDNGRNFNTKIVIY